MRTRFRNQTRIFLSLALLIALGLAMWEAPSREWSLAFIRYVQNLGFIGFLLYAVDGVELAFVRADRRDWLAVLPGDRPAAQSAPSPEL